MNLKRSIIKSVLDDTENDQHENNKNDNQDGTHKTGEVVKLIDELKQLRNVIGNRG